MIYNYLCCGLLKKEKKESQYVSARKILREFCVHVIFT